MEVFDDDLPDDCWAKWVLGAAVPAGIAWVAMRCMTSGYAWLPRRGGRVGGLELLGPEAVWVGLALLAAAIFLHVHYLWNNIDRLQPFADLGKVVALFGLVVAVGVVLWRVLVVI